MVNSLDNYLRFHETALSVRGQRQQLLASNIANADTPNYKARDLDFAAAMNSAMQAGNAASSAAAGSAAALSGTNPQHLAGSGNAAGVAGQALYRPSVQGSVDGNTVDMDVEQTQFADNAIRYEASLTMINMQIKNMLTVIQGQ